MAYLLGIDLGTSSVKCAIVEAQSLKIVATTSQEYSLSYPQSGYVEQSPQEWWSATISAVRAVMQKAEIMQITGIGYSGQMHGTILLDIDGELLHPAIIWADQRSDDILPELLNTVGKDTYISTTGTAPTTGFMASTLFWLKQNQPDLLERVAHVILPKDFIRYKMTGQIATDVSDAASTGLLDIRQGDWAYNIIEKMGLPSKIFPKVVQSYAIAGNLIKTASEALNVTQGVPIVAGCADQPAQAIGNGILSVGRASITSGSGGQIFIPIHPDNEQLKIDNRIHIFNHATTGWYALGAILSAGLALRWLRDLLGLADVPDAYAQLESLANEIPAGSEGLLFLPYLNGERTPHMDASARGAFIGLTSRHTQGHLARAVMEGVAFALRQAFDVCASVTPHEIETLIGAGGGVGSDLWRQIIVDVLNKPIQLSTQIEQGALGASALAGIGLRLYGDTLEDNFIFVEKTLSNYHSITDPSENSSLYQERYDLFLQVYPVLSEYS